MIEKTYKCFICENRPIFNSLKAYKRHMKRNHKHKVGVVFIDKKK